MRTELTEDRNAGKPLRIGFATAVSLRMLTSCVEHGEELPIGYEFGPSAEWIQELMRRGHHVTVYTTAKDIEEAKTFHGPNLTIRIAKCRPWGTGRDFFAPERAQLTRMMKEDKCDLIHAHWTYEFALAALASKRPTLITVHDLPWNVLRFFRDKFRVAKLLMAYGAAFQGKHFTAVSSDAATHFKRYFAPWSNVSVVPNGLSEDVFLMSDGPAHREPGSGFTFATILRGWSARKNALAALNAYQIVRSRHSDARLIMFGEDYGPGEAAQQWADKHGASEGVVFAGRLPYRTLLSTLNTQVDVLLHPSLDESFSMAALEAMALKKPVIAGRDTPGVREVLAYGQAGILVDVTDAEKIAIEMERLATDVEHRLKYARLGYERAYNMYRLGAVFDQYELLYRHVQTIS